MWEKFKLCSATTVEKRVGTWRSTYFHFAAALVLLGRLGSGRLPVEGRVAAHSKLGRDIVGSGIELGDNDRVIALELTAQLLPLGSKSFAVAAGDGWGEGGGGWLR